MLPFEPSRFSTTTGWHICSESFWPSTRAAMSGAPPGGIGTIRWMGRDGYCAAATVENNIRRSETNRACMGLVGAILARLRLGRAAQIEIETQKHFDQMNDAFGIVLR